MREYIVTMAIFLALLFSLVLYLEYDKKRFEESLPQLPNTIKDASPSELKNAEDVVWEGTLHTEKSENSTEDAGTAKIQIQDDFELTEGTEELETLLEDMFFEDFSESAHDHSHPHGSENLLSDEEQANPEDYLHHTPSGVLSDIHYMSPSEQEAELGKIRQKLIETHGNTQEVQTVNRLMFSRMSGSKGMPLTASEAVELLDAVAILWPTESNIEGLEDILRLQRGHGDASQVE